MADEHVPDDRKPFQDDSDHHPDTPAPSARARYSILLIGLLSIGSIACMCALIFALVAV